jgi:hypothetical protein
MKDLCREITNRRAVVEISPGNNILLEILTVALVDKTLPEFLSLLF